MSAAGEGSASTLERRCRWLLHVYPAAYRNERGDEIIGTLLEATPDGRAWPALRDICAMISGGLRARATQNRQRTTAANVRLAALVGVAAYLAQLGAAVLKFFVRYQLASGWQSQYSPFGWPVAFGMVVLLLTIAMVWVGSRRAAVVLGALSAATAVTYAGPWRSGAGATGVAYLALPASPGWRSTPGSSCRWSSTAWRARFPWPSATSRQVSAYSNRLS